MRIQSHHVRSILLGAMLSLALVACGDGEDDPGTDSGSPIDSGSGETDSGSPVDSGSPIDSGSEETDAGSDETDAGSEDPDAGSEPVCAPVGIGAACDAETGECQTGLRCYTGREGDFCSVDRSPDCGGIVHAMCPASAPYCLRPIGSSLGACATEEEAICICAVAADKIQPGEGTEGCPSTAGGR